MSKNLILSICRNNENRCKRRRSKSPEEIVEKLILTLEEEFAKLRFGYNTKLNLTEICDAHGDLWVHEKCATWTAFNGSNEGPLTVTSLVEKAMFTVKKFNL